ncbi:GH92 family glycosyl hydrolase [Schaalia naturae]|uniref:GH92 family glycosyl hydrolase n=1 Tax=Schaalia naturae TaxID=635203 RepID=A0ABW2SJF2_9ACTO
MAQQHRTRARSGPARAAAAALAGAVGLSLVPSLALAADPPAGTAPSFSSSFEDAGGLKESTPFGDGPSNLTGSPFAQGSLLGLVTDVTASGNNGAGENEWKLVDANSRSKWLTKDTKGWAQYRLSEPAAIDSYTLTSANDAAGRDPKDWTVQGSNDGQAWTTLDTRTGQAWKTSSGDNRYQAKTFALTAQTAPYTYYRLDITANNGEPLTQLADWELFDSTRQEPATAMTTQQAGGPSSSSTAKTGVGFTGIRSLAYGGRILADGAASSTNVLYDDVDVAVTDGMELTYKIFPVLDDGTTYAATYAAVDLVLDDGTRLSGLGLTDQNGFGADAVSQGASDSLWPDQWNSIKVDLSALAGRTVTKILLSYDIPADAEGARADTVVAGYLDDVTLDQAPVRDTTDGLVSYVDTRRGTNSSGGFSRANNFPAVAWPNGFNFITPMTNPDSQGTLYQYQANNNAENRPTLGGIGFSHEPSIWMGDRNQLAFMPEATATPTSKIEDRRLSFSHDNEIARPDLYQVAFDNGIQTAVTATDHGGLFRFTFAEGQDAGSVLVDQVGGDATSSLTVGADGSVTGWVEGGSGYPGKTRMFVSGRFDATPTASGKAPEGDRGGARYAAFDTRSDKTVELRVATSMISLDQAGRNLDLELTGRTFEDVQAAATAAWNARLGAITDIKGATDTQLVNVYSDLYRMNLYPNSQFENTGTAESPVYRYASPVSPTTGSATDTETNAKIVDGKIYVNNGFWDTYRTEWPAIALLYPDLTEELVDGFVQQYRDGGWVARWSSPGYADLMTGTSSDAAFAEAYANGRLSTQTALDAYDAALKNATAQPASNAVGRKGLENGIFLGYTSADTHQSASWGLEGFINDYGIAQMARSLSESDDPLITDARREQLVDDAAYFEARCKDYVNMFNPEARTFASRNADGSWVDGADMDKKAWGGAFTEASGWTFAYHAPFDVDGMAALYGGRQGLIDDLDQFLTTPEKAAYSGIHEAREARDVRLGMLGMSNQVAHHIPYVLTEAGDASQGQELISTIQDRLFVGSDIGQGYPGDEDNGEFSAWYVFSALGLYPLKVGSGDYTVGSPMFDSATLHMGDTTLVVNAPGASEGKDYVAGVDINGTPITTTTFDGDLVRAGGTLTFTMSDEPQTWGDKDLSEDLAVPETQIDATTSGFGTLAAEDGTPVAALTDNTMRTSVAFPGDSASLVWTSASGPVSVNRYTLTGVSGTSAPSSWILSGSMDGGATWTELDSREAQSFPFGTQTRPFGVDAPAAYTSYRLEVTSAGDKPLSLAEVELFATAEASDDLSVTPADGLAARVGQEVSGALATVIGPDEDASAYTVKVSAGDGSEPTDATLTPNGLGGFAVSAPHTYAAAGTYTATVSVTDSAGHAAQTTTSVTVARDTTLAGTFNNICLADSAHPASCDGQSSGFKREDLAASGFEQGTTVPVGETGLTFDLPEFVPDAPDNVTTDGAVIALDLGAGATRISLIGTATEHAKDLTATLTFSDGSTQQIPVQFGDWVGASSNPSYGNTVVGRSQGRYIGTSLEGSVKNSAVYATTPVTLDTASGAPKTAVSLTLPKEAGTLRTDGRAHLFAIASDGDRSQAPWLEITPSEGLAVQAGDELSDALASFTGGVGTATATVNWGDGSATSPADVADGMVSGTHAYAEAGAYTVIVTVDDGVRSASTEVAVAVSEPPSYTPTISVDPAMAAPGDTVGISGAGFAPGETVTVTSGGTTLAVTAGQDGGISSSVTIPEDATDGAWTITAIGEVSAVAASTDVTVRTVAPGPVETGIQLNATPSDPVAGQQVRLTATVDPTAATGTVTFLDNGNAIGTAPVAGGTASADVSFASSGGHALTAVFSPDDEAAYTASTSPVLTLTVGEPPAGRASIALSDTEVQAGESLTVTGTGFSAGEKVLLTLASDPVTLTTTTAARDGSLSVVVTIPASTPAGDHTITAAGQSSGLTATAALVVSTTSTGGNGGSTISTDPGSLTSTGAHGILWLVAGAVLLLAAGAATLVARRRRGGAQER